MEWALVRSIETLVDSWALMRSYLLELKTEKAKPRTYKKYGAVERKGWIYFQQRAQKLDIFLIQNGV
jgi:hypothetical protein